MFILYVYNYILIKLATLCFANVFYYISKKIYIFFQNPLACQDLPNFDFLLTDIETFSYKS